MEDLGKYNNNNLNPFDMLGNKLNSAVGRKHAFQLEQMKHTNTMAQLSHVAGLNENASAADHGRNKELIGLNHGNTKELKSMDQKHEVKTLGMKNKQETGLKRMDHAQELKKAVLDHNNNLQTIQTQGQVSSAASKQTHEQESQRSAQEHTQSEAAAGSAHTRTMELHQAVMRSAGDGSRINLQHGNTNLSFERRARAQREGTAGQSTPAQSSPSSVPNRAGAGHAINIGMPIPSDPGKRPGTVVQSPQGFQSNPAYKQWKGQTQNRQAAQQAAAGNPHRF